MRLEKLWGGILADQLYYLNKTMNGVDWCWAIDLPDHFIVEHPIGTVLGRAQYGDFLCIYQGVTVGGNRKAGNLFYPVFGNHVTLYTNATILGNSRLGHHVVVAADTFIIDTDVPDCAVAFGNRGDLIIKKYTEEEMISRYFSGWRAGREE